jgi:hypothetical protein
METTTPTITTLQMRQLGLTYARRAIPLVREQAALQGASLPVRHTELFPVLRSVYDLVEEEHRIPWDNLTPRYQDAFLHSFWRALVEARVATPVPG